MTPWTVAHQAFLSMRFSRQEYWRGLPWPLPGESSWPRDQTWVFYITCIGRQVFAISAVGEYLFHLINLFQPWLQIKTEPIYTILITFAWVTPTMWSLNYPCQKVNNTSQTITIMKIKPRVNYLHQDKQWRNESFKQGRDSLILWMCSRAKYIWNAIYLLFSIWLFWKHMMLYIDFFCYFSLPKAK